MSRLVARLAPENSAGVDKAAVLARAERLAQPDPRGICATGGRVGQTSPESAVVSFWRAWSEEGRPAAERYLLPERRWHASGQTASELSEGSRFQQIRVAWIYALNGGPSQATVVYQVERKEDDGPKNRCARTDTRFTSQGWLLVDLPILDSGPCRP
jgi:hypothetical protein